MLIGSHVGMKGKEMLLGAAKRGKELWGFDLLWSIQVRPQNTRRKPIAELNIEAGQAYMTEHGLSQIVVHAPYIINLGNTKNRKILVLQLIFYGLKLSELRL